MHQHFPEGHTLADCRDRALTLMHALYSLAMSPEEVRSLTPQCITAAEVLKLGERYAQLLFRIEGARLAQKRVLALDNEAADALRKWISVRARHAPSRASEYLFCSQSGEQLGISALFHQVSKVVRAAADDLARDSTAQTWTPRRIGPQVLRNTAIVNWLNAGEPLKEVLRRAGIKNEKGLYRLRQHLQDETVLLTAKP